MFEHKKIKIGEASVEALKMTLSSKSLILLRAKNGYVMCGYLNLRTAERFRDAAVKVTGVSTIAEAVNSAVACCTSRARQLGIRNGQPVKEALKILAR